MRWGPAAWVCPNAHYFLGANPAPVPSVPWASVYSSVKWGNCAHWGWAEGECMIAAKVLGTAHTPVTTQCTGALESRKAPCCELFPSAFPVCCAPSKYKSSDRKLLKMRDSDKRGRERNTQCLKVGKQRQADGHTHSPTSTGSEGGSWDPLSTITDPRTPKTP